MKQFLALHTVRKKIILILKAEGLLLVLSYLACARLPVSADAAFFIWCAFVTLLVLAADRLLGSFITSPVSSLCHTAQKMARLEFPASCEIRSGDEFGILAENLNQMSASLQQLLQERRELGECLSHEMKTPLGIIRAYAEGIQDETDSCTAKQHEKADISRYAGIIIEETERINTLLTALLDLSALECGAAQLAPEPFDFAELLETAAGRLLADIPNSGFRLEYELPQQAVMVCADKQRMEQVLNNLIVNARNHTAENGIIRLSLILQDGSLCFTVFNQGVPVSQESLPRIWDRFYRDKHTGGSGLGLAIVAQILSMHQFSYGAQSLPDGTAFFFSMPYLSEKFHPDFT